MTVKRPCVECGVEMIGRADKVFCSERCRKRAGRRADKEGPSVSALVPSTRVADALRQELEGLGVLQDFAAEIALGLATQLDSGTVVGAAFVSLSKELDRRVEALRLRAERPDSPVLRIQTAVAQKRALLRVVEP